MPTCEIVLSDRRLGVVRREGGGVVSRIFLWEGGKKLMRYRDQHFSNIFRKDETHLKIYDY